MGVKPAVRPDEADEVTETDVEERGAEMIERTWRRRSAGVTGSAEKSRGWRGEGLVDLTPWSQSESLREDVERERYAR